MRIVAIVPAHNEERTVASVVRALLDSGVLSRIIVVDDGSSDGTAREARRAGAEVISLRPNRGKGQAMLTAVQSTTEPIILFLDADLVGLTPTHVRMLVSPVVEEGYLMNVGLQDHGEKYNRIQTSMPLISGQRCVRREVLRAVPSEFWNGFRIEAGINAASSDTKTTPLTGLSFIPKWGKEDPKRGIEKAASMIVEILLAIRDASSIIPAKRIRP